MKALAEYEVDVVVDLSDEPVIGYRERMKIASLALFAGARYLGSDFELKPPDFRPVSTKPSLAVIGTGKRVGKTAISGYLARLLASEGFDPGVVSMGRGGPQHPEVIEGHKMEVGSEYLLEALERGAHAASDYYETAALSRVTTVGCRRCGGGLAGEPFVSNVLEGAEIANGLDTRVTLFDGSGAAMPPVQVERRVLVAGANQDPEYIVGFLGTYRLLLSDLVLLTMSEEPMADGEKVRWPRRGDPQSASRSGRDPHGLQAPSGRRGRGIAGRIRLDRAARHTRHTLQAPRGTLRLRGGRRLGESLRQKATRRGPRRDVRDRGVSNRDKGGGGGRRYAPGCCGGKARLLLR